MNIRLASLLFFSVISSTSLYAMDNSASSFGTAVLSGLIQCGDKIGTLLVEGVKSSPDIARGGATIVMSGAAIYGTYRTWVTVSAFLTGTKKFLGDWFNMGSRTSETHENVKEHREDFQEYREDFRQEISGLNERVKTTAREGFQAFRRLFRMGERITQRQDQQAAVLNRVDQEVKAIHTEAISIDGKVDGIAADMNVLQKDVNVLKMVIVAIWATMKVGNEKMAQLCEDNEKNHRMIKESHQMIQELHDLNLKTYIENVTQANEYLIEHMRQIHENVDGQKKRALSEGSESLSLETVTDSSGKDKERSGRASFFAQVVTPKFTAMDKQIKESELALNKQHQELCSKVEKEQQELKVQVEAANEKLQKVTNILEKFLDKKDKKDKKIEKIEKQKQKIAKLKAIIGQDLLGEKILMEQQERSGNFVYVQPSEQANVLTLPLGPNSTTRGSGQPNCLRLRGNGE